MSFATLCIAIGAVAGAGTSFAGRPAGVAGFTPARPNVAAEVVTVYTSIDEPYFTPVFARFERETGIHVNFVTDSEAAKSAGVAERIIAERDKPRCDVYWGNEVFHTINLADAGCLAPYKPGGADKTPARWRDKGDRWIAVGLRARVVVVSTRTEHAAAVEAIKGFSDLTAPALKGKVGLANPAFGTTSGHMSALQLTMGDDAFEKWLAGLKANHAKLLGGNGSVVNQVAAGQLAAGLTDNDDVAAAQAEGQKVAAIIPDAAHGGTLMVPTTVALVKGAPHEANAKKLVDFLTEGKVETQLVEAKFAATTTRDKGAESAIEVDYARVATNLKRAVETSLKVLQGR